MRNNVFDSDAHVPVDRYQHRIEMKDCSALSTHQNVLMQFGYLVTLSDEGKLKMVRWNR